MGETTTEGRYECQSCATSLDLFHRRARKLALWATAAGALTCQAIEGGGSFTPLQVRDVSAAAVEARGSEKCDVVYHVDDQRYELGGCNREYVGEWAKREGAPIGRRHGRLPLTCQ